MSAFTGLSGTAKEDMLVSLATLVLHDGGKPITAEGINSVITASGNSVAAFWGGMFENLLTGKNVDELIMQPSAGGPAVEGGPAVDAAGEGDKKEDEDDSSSDGSAGGGAADLFGGSDSDDDSDDSDSD
eukprot:TRINITY_DN80096_c0_g1_i1.p2 TRINITY_DN80096_c0_g1~~TRINITY_DN80096_c0_g1_i1.p2  ORF type:complete len:129 (+),score=28.92 TRINITY_DN80096_c0_g1_i1:75-461(+)